MAKKIFYFSLSFLVLVLIFLAAYNLAFKNNVNDPVADPSKKAPVAETPTETAPLSQGSAENLLNERILGAAVSEDNLLYYYSIDDQSLKKSTLEGKNKVVLLSNLPGIASRVLWSPKKDKVLMFLKPSEGGALWYSINIGNKALIPLKGEISRLAWDNVGEKIFYQYTDPVTKKRTLNSANADGSNWKKLTDLGAADFFLSSVPQNSLVSYWSRPTASSTSPLETISVTGENHRTVVSTLFGADYLFAPNGEYAVGSASETSNGKDFSLRIIDTAGKVTSLAIPTLISKVTWSKDSHALYYALPGALPGDALLPNDYFEKPLYTKDTFWKIDISSGKKTRLIDLKENTQALDSSDLFLSQKEDVLYFTDRVSKRLYQIEL